MMSRSIVVVIVALCLSYYAFQWNHCEENIVKYYWNVTPPAAAAAVAIIAGLLLLAIIFCRSVFSKPLIITNNHEDQIGHLIPPGRSRHETARLLRQLKRAGPVPPIYPNSWYQVMRSEDLPNGQVKAVTLLEKQLVVFRTEKGRVCILDAYCPHLGANLGVGGIVKGECIKCPFHGWEFNGETGQCTAIPYIDGKVPSFAKTNVWVSIERNGFICVWFDAEGREPPYLPYNIPQIASKKWSYRGYCIHYVNGHIQDLCENAADAAHFLTIHGPAINGGSSVNFQDSNANLLNRFLRVHLKINWEVLPPPNGHIGHTNIDSYYTLFNKWRLPFTIHAELHQVGPGFLLTSVQLPFAKGIFVQTFVPEGPLLIRMTTHLYFDWWVPNFIANRLLHEIATQIDRDAMMWNNKTFHSKPLLTKEEEGIKHLRRWFSQFYSENSPKLSMRNNLDSIVW